MKETTLRAIAKKLAPPGQAAWRRDRHNRILIRTHDWDASIEAIQSPPAVSSDFKGEFFAAVPELFTSGGAGLRSRQFAVIDDRVIDLHDPGDMRWFLRHYVSWEAPAPLATLLEWCQGKGRIANVYREDGTLERRLDEHSRSTVGEIGLAAPVMEGNELRFYSWRIVMHGGAEVIELDQWHLSKSGPSGPEWRSMRLPGLLRCGS